MSGSVNFTGRGGNYPSPDYPAWAESANMRGTMIMLITGKAEVLEQNGLVLHTIDHDFRAPSVIRLAALIADRFGEPS